jgi:hypothetical protein
MKVFKAFLLIAVWLCCTSTASGSWDIGSTPEDRAALFDYILDKTMDREAFSPIKNKTLHLDIKKGMLGYRKELIEADTDEKIFYALIKISNARKDRHLRVNLVDGGLQVDPFETKQAPIRFAADYGTPGVHFHFVADYAKNISDFADQSPGIGDKLVRINGQTVSDYLAQIEPYIRYSTVKGLWWKFAEELSLKHYRIPQSFYRENVTFELEDNSGRRYSLVLPFLEDDAIRWQGFWKSHGDARYPGFNMEFSTQTYDLYRPQDGKKVLLLDWYGFRENLIADMDRLMDYASKKDLLDYAIICDGSRSRGGSKGVYALQRLLPKSFKTTFGNLRLSDITEAFVREKRNQFNRRQINDGRCQ